MQARFPGYRILPYLLVFPSVAVIIIFLVVPFIQAAISITYPKASSPTEPAKSSATPPFLLPTGTSLRSQSFGALHGDPLSELAAHKDENHQRGKHDKNCPSHDHIPLSYGALRGEKHLEADLGYPE